MKRQFLHLGRNVKIFYVHLCIKYKQSPLVYTLVRSLSSLDSFQICNDQERCIGNFRRALNILHSCNRVDINECDGIPCDYTTFIQEAKYLSEYKEFRKLEDRVDRLLFNSLSGIEKYTKLWNVVQLLLLLSHGQASVEWGFSVNKEIATSNLMEHNLIARRVIKDHV